MALRIEVGQLRRVWYARCRRDSEPLHGKLVEVYELHFGGSGQHRVRMRNGQATSSRKDVVPANNLHRVDRYGEHVIHARRSEGRWVASAMEINYPGHPVRAVGPWRPILAGWPTREQAVGYAKDAIETWSMGMEPIGERVDYRDRRRVLPWHKEAAARRAATKAEGGAGDG